MLQDSKVKGQAGSREVRGEQMRNDAGVKEEGRWMGPSTDNIVASDCTRSCSRCSFIIHN